MNWEIQYSDQGSNEIKIIKENLHFIYKQDVKRWFNGVYNQNYNNPHFKKYINCKCLTKNSDL